MKKITAFLLTLLALVFVFPVLFLAVGSLMGKNELTDLLLPVLKTGNTGYASWKLFPEYPTLRSSTFPVFIMYRFFEGIPLALLEAARLDGAGELRLFFTIAIPLGSPGVISAMVLGFLEYWNLIEQPMVFLKTKELWPLSLYLPNIDMDHAGTAFAASMIALIPAVLVFFAGQDYLEQGIVSTAVKE